MDHLGTAFGRARRRTAVLATVFMALAACAPQDPVRVGDDAGANPIFRNVFTADPAPLVVGDTLFVYVGHDEAGEGELFNITEWVVYSTTDMKHWTDHGPVMKPTDFAWAVRDAWAAQVIEKDGRFWFYTTVEHGPPYNAKAIGVAVADNPLGPFRDARGSALVNDAMTPTPEDPRDWDDIDPTALTDDDGTTWLAWGNRHLYLAKLKPNMIELDGPIREIHLPNYTEGPWLHKRNGLYYLSYACFAYENMFEKICYATAPRITGPWTYRGILTDRTERSFTIHPAIVEYKGRWYFFYHDAKLTLNGLAGAIGRRAVAVEHLYYNADGTIQPIQQTPAGVSRPPAPPPGDRPPIFNPHGPLVTVDSDIRVEQDFAVAATAWPGAPLLYTTANPYATAVIRESFNAGDHGAAALGQTVRPRVDFTLHEIVLYAGDGFGTIAERPVTLALYELDGPAGADGVGRPGRNLLQPAGRFRINYKPQARGLLRLRLPESGRPRLEAGKRYAVVLQGAVGDAPLFWYRTPGDAYPDGTAYRDEGSMPVAAPGDYALALYGKTPVAR